MVCPPKITPGELTVIELWQAVPLLYALGFTCCMIVIAWRGI
jgi:hypothetical protein